MTLATDGHANGSLNGASSGSVTLTTTQSDDIIVVAVHNRAGSFRTVTSITDTAGLSWALRKQLQWDSSGIESNFEIWYAHAPAPLSSDSITVNLSGSASGGTIVAVAVSGANVTSPWDSDASLPASMTNATGAAAVPEVTGVSTNNPDTMIFGFLGAANFTSGPDQAAASGYTMVDAGFDFSNFSFTYVEQQIMAAPLANATVAFASSQNLLGMIVDAIVLAGEDASESEGASEPVSESESEMPSEPISESESEMPSETPSESESEMPSEPISESESEGPPPLPPPVQCCVVGIGV